MFRYGTSYSSFLFDYIFLPRVSIPVTLFFQNSDRFRNCVPSPTVNDFLLKLNITLYNMIGNDMEDPYVVIKDGGYYEPSKEAVEDRWVFVSGVTRQNESSLPRVTPSFGVVFGGSKDEGGKETGVAGVVPLFLFLQEEDDWKAAIQSVLLPVMMCDGCDA